MLPSFMDVGNGFGSIIDTFSSHGGQRGVGLTCMSPSLARLRHGDCSAQCPLSGVTRKTFAQTEFFSV